MKKKAKNTAAGLNAKIDQHIQNLAHLTSQAARSQAMQDYLQTCARFHQYSQGNVFLILIQKPEATRVAGYRKWNQFNRYVKKGEKGIAILAPCMYKVDPDDESSPRELRGFRVVYVFDVSQTDGEPLPAPPEWKSPERLEQLEIRLTAFAGSNDIQVTFKKQTNGVQGVSKGGEIELDPQAGTKTLIHEIAHELMHRDKDRWVISRETMELEAEAVAYVVASHFGLDTNSPNYLALWDADPEKIAARASRIRQTAAEIIKGLERS